MGLKEWLFGPAPKPKEKDYEGTFKMLNGYTPRFTTHKGGIYESQLIRAAIHVLATHTAKLKVEMIGSARSTLQSKMKHGPNEFQTWSQFMYRLRSILETYNTAFIVPVYDEFGEPSGVFTPLPKKCEIVQFNGEPWLRYSFGWGDHASEKLECCGIINKFQLKNDFFGENNEALEPTVDLIHITNQGIEEGVKSAATYRFMARVNNFTKGSDLVEERKKFTEQNLGRDSQGGGLLLFPNTYQDIKQIDVKPWVVDAEQMKIIRENVFEYFGVNEEILTNQIYGDKWAAFYEGAIEPFAIQFSEVMTKMFFTLREQTNGNKVMATANRLQYMSNAEKLNTITQLVDRGIITLNDAREILNLPDLGEEGDRRIIRGEYYDTNTKLTVEEVNDEPENN